MEQGVRSPPNNPYYLNYYITMNLNDVQIMWRTPWLESNWTLMSGSYTNYILWHWIAFSSLRLDPYWKLVLNAYTYVPIPQNYQIALIWSPNLHHGGIYIKKQVSNVYNISLLHNEVGLNCAHYKIYFFTFWPYWYMCLPVKNIFTIV